MNTYFEEHLRTAASNFNVISLNLYNFYQIHGPKFVLQSQWNM